MNKEKNFVLFVNAFFLIMLFIQLILMSFRTDKDEDIYNSIEVGNRLFVEVRN